MNHVNLLSVTIYTFALAMAGCSDDSGANDDESESGSAGTLGTPTSTTSMLVSTSGAASTQGPTSGIESTSSEESRTSTGEAPPASSTGDSATGDSATGDSTTGDSTTGGSATGDSATGDSATGGSDGTLGSTGDGRETDASSSSDETEGESSSTATGDASTSTGTTAGDETEGPVDPPPLTYILNPYNWTPLAAVVPVRPSDFGLGELTQVTITVHGDGPDARDLTATLDPRSEAFQANFSVPEILEDGFVGVPVLGLYPETDNLVEIELGDGRGSYRGELVITTPTLPEQNEEVIVHIADTTRMTPGLTWLNDRLYDEQGRIRWRGPRIFSMARNGNILAHNFREMNWLGRVVNVWSVPGVTFHHDIIELPNGNVLICANEETRTITKDDGVPVTSYQDYIVELDRDSAVQNIWDLRDYLDVSRVTVADRGGQWVHMNTLMYDAHDDSIIVSGRHQGVFKITRDGIHGEAVNEGKELVWILAPHLGWGNTGAEGTGPLDLNHYLLTAVDEEGQPYSDDFQNNLVALEASDDTFHWPVGQHGIQITSRQDGRISFLTFNNQASFVFDGVDSIANGVAGFSHGDFSNDRSAVSYSMAIEYEIDEVSMTVRHAWGFGANRAELYGSYMSGVVWNEPDDHRFVTSNGTDLDTPGQFIFNPHLVELTPENEVVSHLEIQNTTMSAYRGGRIDPYHPAQAVAAPNR